MSGGVRARPSSAPLAPAASGFVTLLGKELLRFWKVSGQTIAAPVVTTLLYLLVFAHAVSGRVPAFQGMSYREFLVPGLAMMALLQNAFANSSSSLIQSKLTGNIVFVLLPPIGPAEFFLAYVLASVVRGLCVALGVLAVAAPLAGVGIAHPGWCLLFALVGAATLGTLGLLAGLWAEKVDQLAAFQNFFIVPLTFLAGVFYSVRALPQPWARLSHFNPFFYLVDGFRFGFFGASDVAPGASFAASGLFLAVACALALHWLRRGYKLRY